MGVAVIASEREYIQALSLDRFVVIDAGAEWCRPCKKLAPVFAKEAKKAEQEAAFYKYDIDIQPALTDRLQIESVPTVLFYDTGREINRLVGPTPKELAAAVKRLLSSNVQQL